MSEVIKMYYKGIRSAMLTQDKKEDVISGLGRIQNRVDAIGAELDAKEDFQSTRTASNEDEQIKAHETLSDETRNLWYAYNAMKKETEELPFFLYTNSEHEDVRKEMQKTVDSFIAKPLGDKAVKEFHSLLYLSTFGGKRTEKRPSTAPLAYEFNVRNGERYMPAVPKGLMNILLDSGLIKDDKQTTESNLTDMGIAVLARLDEKFGSSKAAATFTQKVHGYVMKIA